MLESKCSTHQCIDVRLAIEKYDARWRLSAKLVDEVLAHLFLTAWKNEALRFKQRCEYDDMVPFPIELMHPVAKAMLVWEMRFDGKSAFQRWVEAGPREILSCPARKEWLEAEQKAHFAIWRVVSRTADELFLTSIADGREVTMLHADCPGECFEAGDLVFARILELGGRHLFGEFAGEVVTGKEAREVLRALIAAPAEKRTDPLVAFEAFYTDSLPGECSWEDETEDLPEEDEATDGAA